MFKKLLFFVIGLILSFTLYAQQPDSIRYTKVFGGYRFEKGNLPITLKQMNLLVKDYPEAQQYMKRQILLLG